MRLKKFQKVFVNSMGRTFPVTAIFTDAKKADNYIRKNRDEVIVAEFNNVIFIAEKYNHAEHIK